MRCRRRRMDFGHGPDTRAPGTGRHFETLDTDQRNDLYALMLHDADDTARTSPHELGRFLGLVLAGVLLAGRVGLPVPDDAPTPERPAGTPLTPAEERLKGDVTFLAADAREGRAPGTKGIEAAADYIAEVFKEAGLKPAPGADGYFQPFTISGRPTLGAEQELALIGPDGQELKGELKTDFSPLALGIGAIARPRPDRLRRLWHHRQGRRPQARLRRLRRHRRQGKGRPAHPPRAQQADESPFDGKRTTTTPRFSTRRPTRFSTARPRCFWSTIWPAWTARRTSCSPSAPAVPR